MPSAKTSFGTPGSPAVPSKFKDPCRTKLECDCNDPAFAKKHPELCKQFETLGPVSGTAMRPVPRPVPGPNIPITPIIPVTPIGPPFIPPGPGPGPNVNPFINYFANLQPLPPYQYPLGPKKRTLGGTLEPFDEEFDKLKTTSGSKLIVRKGTANLTDTDRDMKILKDRIKAALSMQREAEDLHPNLNLDMANQPSHLADMETLKEAYVNSIGGTIDPVTKEITFPNELDYDAVMNHTDEFINSAIDRMQTHIPSEFNLDATVLRNVEGTARANAFSKHNDAIRRHLNDYNTRVASGNQASADSARSTFKNNIPSVNQRLANQAVPAPAPAPAPAPGPAPGPQTRSQTGTPSPFVQANVMAAGSSFTQQQLDFARLSNEFTSATKLANDLGKIGSSFEDIKNQLMSKKFGPEVIDAVLQDIGALSKSTTLASVKLPTSTKAKGTGVSKASTGVATAGSSVAGGTVIEDPNLAPNKKFSDARLKAASNRYLLTTEFTNAIIEYQATGNLPSNLDLREVVKERLREIARVNPPRPPPGPPPGDAPPDAPSGAPGDVPGENIDSPPPGVPPDTPPERPATGAPLGNTDPSPGPPGGAQRSRLLLEAPSINKLSGSDISIFNHIKRKEGAQFGAYKTRIIEAQKEIMASHLPSDPSNYVPENVELPLTRKLINEYLNERRVLENTGPTSKGAFIDQFYKSLDQVSHILTREEIAQLKFKELTAPDTLRGRQDIIKFKEKALSDAQGRVQTIRNNELMEASRIRRGQASGAPSSSSNADVPAMGRSIEAQQNVRLRPQPDRMKAIDIAAKRNIAEFSITSKFKVPKVPTEFKDTFNRARIQPGFDAPENAHAHSTSALSGHGQVVTENGTVDVPMAPRPEAHGSTLTPTTSNIQGVAEGVAAPSAPGAARVRFTRDTPDIARTPGTPRRTGRIKDIPVAPDIPVVPDVPALPADSFTSMASKIKFIKENLNLLPADLTAQGITSGSIDRMPPGEIKKIFTKLHKEVLLDRGQVTKTRGKITATEGRFDVPGDVQPGRKITGAPKAVVVPGPVSAPVSTSAATAPVSATKSISTSLTTHDIGGLGTSFSAGSAGSSASHATLGSAGYTPINTDIVPLDVPRSTSTGSTSTGSVAKYKPLNTSEMDITATDAKGARGGRGYAPLDDTPKVSSAKRIAGRVAESAAYSAGKAIGTAGRLSESAAYSAGKAIGTAGRAAGMAGMAGKKLTSGVKNYAGKQLQTLRMSAQETFTPAGARTAITELGDTTNVGSMVAGYYAYTNTQKWIQSAWKDKSDGAKFITDLTAAEMGNLVGTVGMYVGKPLLPTIPGTLRAGYQAASAFASAGKGASMSVRSVAALRSVTSSMTASQSAMRSGFNTGRALSMGAEIGTNLAKTGGAVFVSLAAEVAATEAMKAMGVTSHVWLEGNAAAAGGLAGTAVLLATEALSGPVGWAMLGITGIGIIYAYAHGAAEDEKEREERKVARRNIQMQLQSAEIRGNIENTYKRILFGYLAKFDGDVEKAKAFAQRDPEFLKLGLGRISVLDAMDNTELDQMIAEHFTDTGIINLNKPSLGEGLPKNAPTDPDMARISDIYNRAFMYQYAVASGATKDLPNNITPEELKFINEKTNNTFQSSIQLEVALQVSTGTYTTQRVIQTQQEIYRSWQEDGIIIDEMDPLMQQIANIDPNFYETYHTNVTLDAQFQLFKAFNQNNMLLDDMPESLVGIALQDPDFLPLYRNYTRKMIELAEFYDTTVQDIVAKQTMTQEEMDHLTQNLQAEQQAELDKVRASNQALVDKYNAELAARISSYGTDLPEIIRNMSQQLLLSGSGRLFVGSTAEDLYQFLRMEAPEVTFTVTEPTNVNVFEFDPSKHIDTTPTGNVKTSKLLSNYQNAELEARLKLIPDATDADRKRLRLAIETGNGELLYTEDDDARDTLGAKAFGISLADYRALKEDGVRKKVDKQFKPEELSIINEERGKTVINVPPLSNDSIMQKYQKEIEWEKGLNRASGTPVPEDEFTQQMIAKYRRQERINALSQAENPTPQAPQFEEYTDAELIAMEPERYQELRTEFERQAAEDNFPMTDDMYDELIAQHLRREDRERQQTRIDSRPTATGGPPQRLTDRQLEADPALRTQIDSLNNAGLSRAEAYEIIRNREYNRAQREYAGANVGDIYDTVDDQSEIEAIQARQAAEEASKTPAAPAPAASGAAASGATPATPAPAPAPAPAAPRAPAPAAPPGAAPPGGSDTYNQLQAYRASQGRGADGRPLPAPGAPAPAAQDDTVYGSGGDVPSDTYAQLQAYRASQGRGADGRPLAAPGASSTQGTDTPDALAR